TSCGTWMGANAIVCTGLTRQTGERPCTSFAARDFSGPNLSRLHACLRSRPKESEPPGIDLSRAVSFFYRAALLVGGWLIIPYRKKGRHDDREHRSNHNVSHSVFSARTAIVT